MSIARALCGVIAAAAFVAVAGCNTTKGAAQDVQAVGESIEGAAKDSGAR